MKKLLITVIMIVAILPLRAQNDKCNNAKNNMEEALKVGNCKQVESFYNSIYLKEYKCPRDKNIELKIANCGKDNTPKPKPKPTPPTQPTSKDQTITVNGVSFKMVYVEGGTFIMGDNSGDTSMQGGSVDEKPAHQVTLTKDYYIGETEVTQALWKAVMGSEPTEFGGWTKEKGLGDNYPAYRISWYDAQSFIERLNKITGLIFRLPTEAEWEYAARGGAKSRGYKYIGTDNGRELVNNGYQWPNSYQTIPCKTKKPNELGLYDMNCNVWEWCSDWFGYYGDFPQTDPIGPPSGSRRCHRGGTGCQNEWFCRPSHRGVWYPSYRGPQDSSYQGEDKHYNFIGFRLVLVP